MPPRVLLAGDVGGTNVRLGLFAAGSMQPLAEAQYESAAYGGIRTIIDYFLGTDKRVSVDAAVVAVAGPVVGGASDLTNLPWRLDTHQLEEATGTPRVQLINDQVGLAHFVARNGTAGCEVLNATEREPAGLTAILAPGTGLGQGFLTWNAGDFQAHPSEGGHADFAPVDLRQARLLEFMLARHARVSVERVCSGMGLPALHDFLREVEGWPEPEWFRGARAAAEDPTAAIVSAAMGSEPPEICAETVRLFVSILAQEAGNLCWKVLPRGGLFLGGGIPPRILPYLQSGFMTQFRKKGRMSPLLETMPVYVITHQQPTLLGAGWAAARLLELSDE